MIMLIIIIYTVLIIFEFVPLYKQHLRNELFVNSVLFLISFTIAILLSLRIVIPSPLNPIKNMIVLIFGK